MSASDDFKLLRVLDSPLLEQFAPELLPFRDRVKKAGEHVGPCTPCEKRRIIGDLTTIQLELSAVLEASPVLTDLLPQLLATATR